MIIVIAFEGVPGDTLLSRETNATNQPTNQAMTIQAKRNDIHRPSILIASDYTHLAEFGSINYGVDAGGESQVDLIGDEDYVRSTYGERGAKIHGDGNLFQCDICGARYKYGSLFQHNPTNEVIVIGHDCADKMALAFDHIAAGRIQDEAKAFRNARRKSLARKNKLRAWINGELVGSNLAPTKELLSALNVARGQYIVKSIRADLVKWIDGRYPGLSIKQAALVIKLADEVRNPKPEEKHVALPVDGERIVVEGEVVSAKTVSSMYGDTVKIVVKVSTPEGSWLVYGTRPSSLYDDLNEEFTAKCEAASLAGEKCPEWTTLKGRTVSFTAKVVKGNKDEHFGFFSRPTKATLVA